MARLDEYSGHATVEASRGVDIASSIGKIGEWKQTVRLLDQFGGAGDEAFSAGSP